MSKIKLGDLVRMKDVGDHFSTQYRFRIVGKKMQYAESRDLKGKTGLVISESTDLGVYKVAFSDVVIRAYYEYFEKVEKSLNFFKKVSAEVSEGKSKNTKVIDIFVEEKPTGEITAGAGIGTSGGTLVAGVKENNYLGKGLAVEANGTLTAESFKGLFSVTNPNYKNSDKAVFVNLQAVEIDQLSTYGYKTNKAGFGLGTKFEYLSDLNLGLSTTSFYEKIETDSTASARQKKQKGLLYIN